MNFKFYIEKLFDSESFKEFIKENKDAFPASGFFIVDKQGADNKQHIDYFIPSKREMFSFNLEDNCKKVPVEIVDSFSLKKENQINLENDFDFERIEKMIEAEMWEKKIKNKIHKFIFSLQGKNGQDFILATVFISNMGLLKVIVDLKEMKITSFEKKSFMDFIRIKKKD